MELNSPRLHILPLIIGSVALVLFVSIMLYGLISGRSGLGTDPVPLLKTNGPVKTAPDGLHIRPEPHRKNTVFDVFDATSPSRNEQEVQMLESSEEPDFSKINRTKIPEPDPANQKNDNANKIVADQSASETLAAIPVKPKSTQPTKSAKMPTPTAGHFIQLAAFIDENTALNSWQNLKTTHANLLAKEKPWIKKWEDLNNNKVFYRLLIGPFTKRESAETLCNKLQNLNQSCFVRNLPAQ